MDFKRLGKYFALSITAYWIGILIGVIIRYRDMSINEILIHITGATFLYICVLIIIMFLAYMIHKYMWNKGICRKCNHPWAKFTPTSLYYICSCRTLSTIFIHNKHEKK